MTPIDWPDGLPCFRWKPYQVAPRPGSLEETLGMITNLSRVYTQNNEVVSCELVLNATQEPIFRTFYKTTLSMGTQWFNAEIWRNSQLEMTELLFYGAPPVFTSIAQNVVRASFTLLTRGENAPPGPPPELACPGLTIPVDGTAVGEVTSATLLWTAVSGAATYRVYVWEDGDPQPGSPTTTTADLTYEVTGLSINTTYRWVVDAVSSEVEVSPSCESATFSTDEAPPGIEWLSATFTGDIFADEVTLTVIRTGDSSGSASADYDFTEGSALIGPDFIATPGTVTFAPGEVSKEVVVTLVRDYDSEMLAFNPDLYCRMDSPSPTTSFPDLTGNGHPLVYTGLLLTYQQQDILLDPGGSIGRSSGTSNFRLQAQLGTPTANPNVQERDPYTSCGWEYITNANLNLVKTICHHGGSSGGGQFYKGFFYLAANTQELRCGVHTDDAAFNPSGYKEAVFTTVIPLGVPFWWVAGYESATNRWFFKLNDNAPEYQSIPGGTWYPNFRPDVSVGTYFMCRANGNNGDTPGGYGARFAFFYSSNPDINMYTRWRIDAALTFVATLSNPVGAALGAIDETTMTIEAP